MVSTPAHTTFFFCGPVLSIYTNIRLDYLADLNNLRSILRICAPLFILYTYTIDEHTHMRETECTFKVYVFPLSVTICPNDQYVAGSYFSFQDSLNLYIIFIRVSILLRYRSIE